MLVVEREPLRKRRRRAAAAVRLISAAVNEWPVSSTADPDPDRSFTPLAETRFCSAAAAVATAVGENEEIMAPGSAVSHRTDRRLAFLLVTARAV